MIGATIRFEESPQLIEAVERGTRAALARGAFAVRQEAIASIQQSSQAGPAGGPVRTRRGLAKRGILYAATQDEAVIGFDFSVLGTAMEKHEKGGRRGNNRYPRRPTMQLALARAQGKIAGAWAGAISR